MPINYGDKIPEGSDLSTVISYVDVLNAKVKELRNELAKRLDDCNIDTSGAKRIEQLIALINDMAKLPVWCNNGVWIDVLNPSFTIYDGVALNIGDYIYVLGGKYTSGGYSPVVQNDTRRYSIENNTWEELANIPYNASQHVGGVLNNKIYIHGGYTGSSTASLVYEYDRNTDTWTRKTAGTSRQNHAAVVLDNQLYIMGGYSSGSKLKTMQAYNAATDTFTNKASMISDRDGLTADVVNGKIYAIGGKGSNSNLANECYDPVTNTWTAMKNLPSPIENHGSGVSGDKIIIIDGYDSTYFQNNVFYYDTLSNKYYDDCTDDTMRLRNIITATTKYGIFCLGGETDESISVDRATYYKTGKLRCLSEIGSGGSGSDPVSPVYYIYNNGVYEHLAETGELIVDTRYPDVVSIVNNSNNISITLNPDVYHGPSKATFKLSNLDTSKYNNIVVEYSVEHSTSYVNPDSNSYIHVDKGNTYYEHNIPVSVGSHQEDLNEWTIELVDSVDLTINFEVEYTSDYNGYVQIILNKVYMTNK